MTSEKKKVSMNSRRKTIEVKVPGKLVPASAPSEGG